MKAWWKYAAGTMLCVSLLVSGCGSTAPSGNSNGGSTAKSGDKTLVFGRGGDSVTLDPANSTDDESNMVSQEVYDTLTTYKLGTSQLEGDLATDWQVSNHELTWTFHLVKGVTFQDGTPFNADAVVFNFDRWWDKSNPYHKGSFRHFGSDLGGFKGDKSCVIKDVKKVDDNTVEIDLTHPFAPLAAMLSQIAFGMASPANIKQYNGDFHDHPVGTGAFEFVSWAPNDKIILKKNPNYRVPGLPKLDKIIYQVIKDNTARLNALQAGQIDLMEGLNPSDAQTVKNNPNLNLIVSPSNNVGYLAMNVKIKPFDDPRVRQAVNMAIDKKALIDAYYEGYADPAVTVLPPKNWAFDAQLSSYPVDLAKAKQLLAAAGFPNGFNTELWAMPVPRPYMPQPEKIGTAIQADLKKIGINAKIVSYDWATYLKKTADGDAPMCLLGWSAGTWDPTTFMYTLLDGANTVPPANNVSFYVNPKVDQLLSDALKVSDQAKRKQLYDQAQELIHQDAPMVPLVHSDPVMADAKYVVNFVPQTTSGPQFTNVDIQK